jgi:hypothetical protein
MKLAIVFPGQGSQAVGMLKAYDGLPHIDEVRAQAAEALGREFLRLLDEGPLAIGSRALIRQPKFPPAMWKVVEIDPGRRFVWRSGFPGMWVYGHHSVEPIAGGARATLRLHYEGLLGALMARLTRGITERYLGYEAAGLKRRSEGSG